MSKENSQSLEGPLKHVRAAALAAALVPLASIAATPAEAQTMCQSAGICGVVWHDTNNNGIQDPGEGVIEGAVVTIATPMGDRTTSTGANGVYYFEVPDGEYVISVQIPPGTQASPADEGSDDTVDSDGVSDGLGNSVATVTLSGSEDVNTDFGFWTPSVEQPGTGTPGYWKNHPEAWPVNFISVGGITYTKEEALALLDKPGKDKTLTMFSSLVPAMLNVKVGNDGSCVASTIIAADEWMKKYGPVGSGVHAASFAWKVGEPLHRQMDNYNNGMLCAPHRD
jgi:hypothetical protein